MGSSGNNQVLAEISNACLRLNRQMIISGLSNLEAEKLIALVPELKTKAIIKPLINADEILENCDLTICHGGSGTVYQSLMANTPVLCFPHNPDQGLSRLQRLGLAHQTPRRPCSGRVWLQKWSTAGH